MIRLPNFSYARLGGGGPATLFGVVAVLAAAAAALSFVEASRRVERQEAAIAHDRAAALDKTLQRAESVIAAMRDMFVFHLDMAEAGNYRHPLAASIRDTGPSAEGIENLFAIEPDAFRTFSLNTLRLEGTLTGIGTVAALSERRRQEVDAALALGPLLGHAMRRVSDAVWAYFLSADNLLYLTPSVPSRVFGVRPSLYRKPFWTEALQDANPDHRTVVSSVYQDAAGAGLMVTVSLPVWRNGEYRGITAVDIGLATLNAAVREGASVGTSRLVDENGLVTASPEKFEPNTSAGVPGSVLAGDYVELWQDGRRFWSAPAQRGELWVVHSAGRHALWRAAARLAAPAWTLLAFVVLLVYLLLKLRHSMAEVRDLSQHDPLTGAYNRRAFETLAIPLLAQCGRQSKSAVVMMLDADHFKQINDQHGHSVGDQTLLGIAGIVSSTVREADLFCRFGGEEFVVLAPFASAEAGERLAERLRSRVQEARFADAGLQVTVSIGIGLWLEGRSLEEVVEDADGALYRAKASGRNRVEVALGSTGDPGSGGPVPATAR